MKTIRIPLFGSLTNRNSNPVASATKGKDQQFINFYPEFVKNEITGKTTVYLYKRPGTTLISAGGSGYSGAPGSFMWVGGSTHVQYPIMPFIDGSNLKVFLDNGGTAVQVGATLAGVSGGTFMSETQISGTSTLTLIMLKNADGLQHGWYWTEVSPFTNGTWTEITSGNFPPNQSPTLNLVGGFAHLDGYAFVMDVKGSIWNSDLNSIANWTATSYVNSNSFPDGGGGVARLGNFIVAFGGSSIEFYRNAGNPTGSPLARIGEAVRGVGLFFDGGGIRYLTVGDNLYFVGRSAASSAKGIYVLSGVGVPKKISDAAIDKDLVGGADLTIVGAFQMHGMTHIMFSVTFSNQQPCYCVDTGIWWYMLASSAQSYWVSACGQFFTQESVTNKGYYYSDPTLSNPTFVDNLTAYTATIQTGLIDFGTANRKFYSKLRLIGDVQSTSGSTGIAWSDDDYATFTTAVNVDMSVANPEIIRLGKGRRRSFKITDAVNRPLRLEAMEIDYEVGTS